MKKDVWILCTQRADMIEAQRRVNENGGLRAFCLFQPDSVYHALERAFETNTLPSLLLVDYESGCKDGFAMAKYLLSQPTFAGIPCFFMSSVKEKEIDEKCYEMGATVVLHKPFSDASMLRIERTVQQHEMTKNIEKIVQKQMVELAAAKEIKRLNEQLSSRNDLLYRILGKYFSDEVVEVILEHPQGAAIGGEKRKVTVLMADLRGFTALSERLLADTMVTILNDYLSEMTEVIMECGGTIIEFIGDAILAVFGAPLVAEHAADDAVAVAIEMQNRIVKLNAANQKKAYPEIEAGIGVHTGEVFIGNIGSERFMRYNVIGQVVNLCSRIQTYAVGGQILVSENVLSELCGEVKVGKEFEISMKGIHSRPKVSEVKGISGIYESNLMETIEEEFYDLVKPVGAVLYLLQGKSVVRDLVAGKITKICRHRICVECHREAISGIELYQDMEIMIGEENAYAKIVKIEGDSLELHFTFMSENFLGICGFREERGHDMDGISGKESFIAKNSKVYFYDRQELVLIWEEEKKIETKEQAARALGETGGKILFVAGKEDDRVYAKCLSCDYRVRAVELTEFLFGQYGVAKGSQEWAEGSVPAVLLSVCISDTDVENAMEYFLHRSKEYFSDCEIIELKDFAAIHKQRIEAMKEYEKADLKWAFVNTPQVVPEGTQIRIRTLENDAGVIVQSRDGLYLMIGCRGEVYQIEKEKFDNSYEVLDEKFDVFMQVLDFIPNVERVDDGAYIPIDEMAYLCKPKKNAGILAEKLQKRTKVFPKGRKDYYMAQPGDYLAVRKDDFQDMYIIKADVFKRTYVEKRREN